MFAIATAIAVVVACGGGGTDRPAARSANDRVERTLLSHLPAFANAPWADAMKADQDRFDSLGKPSSKYGAYSIPDFASPTTNVVGGERVTVRMPCEGCPRRIVWLIGTSAAFGLGQRDEHTIASELNRLGVASGIDLQVRNLGVPGVTALDELDGLRAHLRLDDELPHLVVVYGGWNDVMASYMYATVEDGALLDPIRFDGPWAQRYLDADPPPELRPADTEPVAKHVAAAVNDVRREMASELSRRGIASAFFWQPDAFADPDQLDGLATALNVTMAQLSERTDLPDLIAATTERLDPEVVDLRPAVARLDQPVFADPTHMNEAGAAAMATEIFAAIRDELRT